MSSIVGIVAAPVATLLTDLVDRLFPDKVAQAQQREEFMQKAQELNVQLLQGQMAIDQVEAGNDNLFVSGWRPFVGWAAGVGFIFSTLILPIIMAVGAIKGVTLTIPAINEGLLETVLLGMLGLRGFEKMGDKGHLPWQQGQPDAQQ